MLGVLDDTTHEKAELYVGGVTYATVSAIRNGSDYKNTLTTSFWKHGQAGLMKHLNIKPCFWYGK